MPRKVILDVDTGSDDAVAIMLAALHPSIDLIAVCSVSGNQPLLNTTENTKKILDLLHSNVPLYMGCKEALVRDCSPWRIKYENRATAIDKDGKSFFIHQDFDLPKSNRNVEDKPAPVFYVDYLKHTKEPITLVCVGPLTNLATALSIDPSIIENIEELVIMGGGDRVANATSSAEFNIFHDPEAAQKVFQSGIKKITLCPLDATHKVVVTKDDCKRFKEIGTPAALFAASMCEKRIEVHTQCQPLDIKDACALHDPLCIAYLIDNTVLKDIKYVHIDVSLSGASDGTTLVDHRHFQNNPNVYIAYDGDRKKFVDIMCDAFVLSK